MANQAIALQARAPRGNILGPALQQGAQMVNMMRQQEAADLQAAATNEQLRIARAKEDREAIAAQQQSAHNKIVRPLEIDAAQAANINAQIKNNLDFVTLVNTRVKNARNPEDVIEAAAELRRQYPTQSQYMDRALASMPTDPAKFEDWRMLSVFQSQDAKDQMADIEVKQSADGTFYLVRSSKAPGVKPAALPIPTYKLDNSNPSSTNPTPANAMAAPAPAPNPMAAPAPAPNPMAAPMPGPNTNPVGGAPLNIQSGNMYEPTSMRVGPPMSNAQPKLADIIKEATASRKISESNLQMIRDVAGPDKDAQLIQLLKANNIDIVPDESPFRSAAMRFDEAPQFQQTQSMEGYTATNEPFRGKPPMQGPIPGSALVPPSVLAAQAGAEARARGQVEKSLRETPKEAAAKAAAIARANAAADAEKKASEKLPARKQVSTLLKKIRNAYEELDKSKAIPSETRNMAANAMDYFASTALGREGQKMLGTKSSKYLSEIINSRKLLATAIKNAAGMTAQEMNSNVELQLTLDALTDPTQGIEAARSTLNNLEELFGAPGAVGSLAGISPLRRPGGPEYNPRTQAPKPQGQPARPRTEAEFNRLPVGTQYVNPADGKVLVKVR